MAWSLKGRKAWFVQSPHLILGSSQTPGTNLLAHAGAYPGLPVLLLSKRVGKTSSRPRKRDRKRFTFSAGVVGITAAPTARRGTRLVAAECVTASWPRSDANR